MYDYLILGGVAIIATILAAWAINYVLKDGQARLDYEYYSDFRDCVQKRVNELDDDAFATQAEWEHAFELARYSDKLAANLSLYYRSRVAPPGTIENWAKKVRAGE